MEFTYFGGGCLLVSTRQLKVLVDPPGSDYGLKLPKLQPNLTLHTVQKNGGLDQKNGMIIDSPGEYEFQGLAIHGIAAQLHVDQVKGPRRGVMYLLESGGVHVLVTGNIAPDLNDKQSEVMGEVNILVVPVGGHGLTLDGVAAAKLVSQIEPAYVIPVHYNDGKTKYPVPQDGPDMFLKEVGAEGTKPVAKFKLASPSDLGEGTQVIVLEPQG